jgi:membrane-associated phospholipid phosphatase
VHFPADVVAGALLGAGIGALAAWIALKLIRPAPVRAA